VSAGGAVRDLAGDLLGATVVEGRLAPFDDRGWRVPPVPWDDGRPDAAVRVRADDRCALVRIYEVGSFLIEDGERVVVDAEPGAGAIHVEAWLHGTVAAVVAGQQGRFALHATVVELDGARIGLSGRRGAGKSTNALAAVQAGARLVADDVAVLEVVGERVEVAPYGRRVHVWPDTAERLGLDLGGVDHAVGPAGKLHLAVPPGPTVPLDALVVLAPAEVDRPTRHRLEGLAALRVVRNQTYRAQLVHHLWPQVAFTWQAAVAERVAVERLVRPEAWSVDAVVGELRDLASSVA
jgi:hypothetical protein